MDHLNSSDPTVQEGKFNPFYVSLFFLSIITCMTH